MTHYKKSSLALFLIVAVTLSCSKDDDPNPPPGPGGGGGGSVTITSVEGGHMFWGDEMTITGTGFSATKADNIVKLTSVPLNFCGLNYTSEAGGAIEIVSATTTQLKVLIPCKKSASGFPTCGPERATLEITVNGKTAKKEGMKFIGPPEIGQFLYHYGWFDIPSVTRIGDSVMIDGGLQGFYATESDLWDQTTLTIDGAPVPIKHRTIGLETGWAFYLPVEEFGEMSCSTEPEGWDPAREMTFEISAGGKSASIDLWVQYLPQSSVSCSDCPAAGGTWKITGKNIYYTEARFTPQAPCTGPSQGIALNKETFDDEFQFDIPLSILAVGCTYSVSLNDPCGRGTSLGFFSR